MMVLGSGMAMTYLGFRKAVVGIHTNFHRLSPGKKIRSRVIYGGVRGYTETPNLPNGVTGRGSAKYILETGLAVLIGRHIVPSKAGKLKGGRPEGEGEKHQADEYCFCIHKSPFGCTVIINFWNISQLYV